MSPLGTACPAPREGSCGGGWQSHPPDIDGSTPDIHKREIFNLTEFWGLSATAAYPVPELTVRPQAKHFTSLSLSFHICKTGAIIEPTKIQKWCV